MFRAPQSDEVLDDLGGKVTFAISRSVGLARMDLARYRAIAPGWVATSTERGLANWIHDRMWPHLVGLVDGLSEVTVYDKEPKREIFVGTKYRLRIKRHHQEGVVSSYPTQTALDFFGQGGTLPIPTLEEVCLIAGYEWDREARKMGAPLLSLRNGRANIIWMIELPEAGDQGSGGTIVRPTVPGPTGPTITTPGIGDKSARTEGKAQE